MNGIPTSSRRRGELGGDISEEKKRSTSHIKLPDAQEIFIDKGKQDDKLSSFLAKDNENISRHQMVGSKQSQISQSEFMRYRQQIGDSKIKRNSSIHSNKESAICQQEGIQDKRIMNIQQQQYNQQSQDTMRLVPKQENHTVAQAVRKGINEQRNTSDYHRKQEQLYQQTSPVEITRHSSHLQMVKSAMQFNEGISRNDQQQQQHKGIISRDNDNGYCFPDQNNINKQKQRKQIADNNDITDRNIKEIKPDQEEFEGMTKCKRATSYLMIDNSYTTNNANTSSGTYQGIMSFGVEQPVFRNNIVKQQHTSQQQSLVGITNQDNHYNTQPNLQQKCLTSRGKEQTQGINEIDIQRYSSQLGQAKEQRNSLVMQKKHASPEEQQLQQKYHNQGAQLMNDRSKDQLQGNNNNNNNNNIIKKSSPVNAINIELQDMNLELQSMNKKLSEQINHLENKTKALEMQLKQSESHKVSAVTNYNSLQQQIEQLQAALSEIKVQTEIERKQGDTSRVLQQQQQQLMNHNNRENMMSECNINYNQKRNGKSNYNNTISNPYQSEQGQIHAQEQEDYKRKQLDLMEDYYGGAKSDITSLTTGVSQKSSGNIKNIQNIHNINNYSTNHMYSYEQQRQECNSSSFFEHTTASQEKEQQLQQQHTTTATTQGLDKAVNILSSIYQMVCNDGSKCSMNNLESLPGIVHKLIQENKQNTKFISSMKELLMKCAPVGYFESEQPSLQLIWKFIKKIMEEYSSLKTQAMQAEMVGLERGNMSNQWEDTLENMKDNNGNDDKKKINIGDSMKIQKQQGMNTTNHQIEQNHYESQIPNEMSHRTNGNVLENQDQIKFNDQQTQLIEYSTNFSQTKDDINITSSLDANAICECLGISSAEQIMSRLNDLMSLAEIATAYCGVAQDVSKQSFISPQQLYECLAEIQSTKIHTIPVREEEGEVQLQNNQKEQSPCSSVSRVESSQCDNPADQICEDSKDQLKLNKIH